MSSKLLRPLLALLLASCQSASPTPDAPTPRDQPPGDEAAQASCCPAGTTQVDACADEAQCIHVAQRGQPVSCAIPPAPESTDESGPQLCDAFLGYRWDGQQCRGASGCSRGTGDWYDSKEVCQRAHSQCDAAAP